MPAAARRVALRGAACLRLRHRHLRRRLLLGPRARLPARAWRAQHCCRLHAGLLVRADLRGGVQRQHGAHRGGAGRLRPGRGDVPPPVRAARRAARRQPLPAQPSGQRPRHAVPARHLSARRGAGGGRARGAHGRGRARDARRGANGGAAGGALLGGRGLSPAVFAKGRAEREEARRGDDPLLRLTRCVVCGIWESESRAAACGPRASRPPPRPTQSPVQRTPGERVVREDQFLWKGKKQRVSPAARTR
mmetsp:Transcript_27319/g.80651  ORF Transcript_27319/g.80651 Transcript_27319/m.80651 type:complete len:249 (-) Transcript_27319:20-766(-)